MTNTYYVTIVKEPLCSLWKEPREVVQLVIGVLVNVLWCAIVRSPASLHDDQGSVGDLTIFGLIVLDILDCKTIVAVCLGFYLVSDVNDGCPSHQIIRWELRDRSASCYEMSRRI